MRSPERLRDGAQPGMRRGTGLAVLAVTAALAPAGVLLAVIFSAMLGRDQRSPTECSCWSCA